MYYAYDKIHLVSEPIKYQHMTFPSIKLTKHLIYLITHKEAEFKLQTLDFVHLQRIETVASLHGAVSSWWVT